MAKIGTFTLNGHAGFTGEIHTLTVRARVDIVPNERREQETAPDFRVLAEKAEIGAGWVKTTSDGRAYLALKLDDPSFPAPLFASLFEDESGAGHSLIWSRPAPRRNGE